jgi:signal transduction histidine kinase
MDFGLPSLDILTGRFRDHNAGRAFERTQNPTLTRQARFSIGALSLAFAAFVIVDLASSTSDAEFLQFLVLRFWGTAAGLAALLSCPISASSTRRRWVVTLYETVMFGAFVGIVALDPTDAMVNCVSVLVFLVCIYMVLPNTPLFASVVAWPGTAVFVAIESPFAGSVESVGLIALLVLTNAIGTTIMWQFQAVRRREFMSRRALARTNAQLLREVQAHRHTTALLRAATETAQRANEAKTRFLAIASHDIRQPMQAINLLSGALAAQSLPMPAIRISTLLAEAIEGLNTLLDALLDISRMDAGLVTPQIRLFPVDELLSHIEEQAFPSALAKGLRLRRVRTTATITSDYGLLERLLEQLVANAIRYTQEGGVVFGVRRRTGQMRIEVWDSGLGISPENLPLIFEEFHQVGNSAHNRSDGLGLGLAIANRLAKLLGGAILVDSIEGRGSRFTLSLSTGAASTDIVQSSPFARVPRD